MSSKLLAALPATLMLAACQHGPVSSASMSPDPAFGESVKYNAAIQTIDPDPVYAEGGAQPGGSGVKGSEAVKRYRTDAVKGVETISTSSGGGGSGSGGGSNPG